MKYRLNCNFEHKDKWDRYCDGIYPYFENCKDKTVLEIGPYWGIQTQIIELWEPKSLTLVEANKQFIPHLTENFKLATVIHEDIFLYLEKPRVFDVVVCCGVLYHFHSPLYLLELIANRVSPKCIIIETFAFESPTLTEEDDDTPGNRQLSDNWKSAKISLKLPKQIIITAMNNIGYKLVHDINSIEKPTRIPTSPPIFLVFEKQ